MGETKVGKAGGPRPLVEVEKGRCVTGIYCIMSRCRFFMIGRRYQSFAVCCTPSMIRVVRRKASRANDLGGQIGNILGFDILRPTRRVAGYKVVADSRWMMGASMLK